MESDQKWPEAYERDKLYEEVWAEPVKIVAQRYGVSDVALAKTCRKLGIPLPGRGHNCASGGSSAAPRRRVRPASNAGVYLVGGIAPLVAVRGVRP